MKSLASNDRPREIPEASLRRLPIYYRSLQMMMRAGISQVSCADLARALGLDPTLVRKDIEMTGIVGKPRVGYTLQDLVQWIENFLGWNRPKKAVLVGAGSLGSALLGYDRFRSHGMEIVAVFDIDREKIGKRIHDRLVQPLMLLPDFITREHVPLGLIAVPAAAAQSVADLMVVGGIRAIWNFAPAHVRVPARIILQNEDLYHSLASLSFKLENVPPENGIIYAEDN
ncbi:MAG TPA: redox-sensing transcriptional repressor Rex [Bryobacteraceae bacterium]|nr:redox-sensing transcriptional repressor Rex [Bryobacteraceae bacterium]